MKTGFKRFLCSALAVTTMIGMSAIAFAADDSSSEAGSSTSTSETATESSAEEATEESSVAETPAESEAVTTEAGSTATEAVSNPSTGVDSTMLPLSVMGVFLVLAGGVAAVTAKRKTNNQ